MSVMPPAMISSIWRRRGTFLEVSVDPSRSRRLNDGVYTRRALRRDLKWCRRRSWKSCAWPEDRALSALRTSRPCVPPVMTAAACCRHEGGRRHWWYTRWPCAEDHQFTPWSPWDRVAIGGNRTVVAIPGWCRSIDSCIRAAPFPGWWWAVADVSSRPAPSGRITSGWQAALVIGCGVTADLCSENAAVRSRTCFLPWPTRFSVARGQGYFQVLGWRSRAPAPSDGIQ